MNRVAAIAATAGLALVPAAPALADEKYGSSGEVANSFPAFHGRVSSPNALCEENRKVILYSEQIGKDDVLGRTRTNERGRWKIEVEPTSGAFHARCAGAAAPRSASSAAGPSRSP